MTRWCDLADETKDGIIFGMQLENALRRDPERRKRNELYHSSVANARAAAATMTAQELIDQLVAKRPGYILELLETEDERFGVGALIERYARTFYKDYAPSIEREN